MTLLSQRVVVVEIGFPNALARRVTSADDGLRISFRATRKSSKAPDPCEVNVWNLSTSSLGSLRQPAILTRVLAGYGSDVQQVASGTIVPASLQVEREGGDVVSTWQIQDGGYDVRTVFVARAWDGHTPASDVIEYVRSLTSWARGAIELGTDVAYRQGYVAFDTASGVLDEVCRDCGCRWSVIDGRLSVWPVDSPRQPQIPLLTPDTGLLQSRRTDDGAQFVALLMPGLRQGDRVRVERQGFSGDWLVREVEHRGDSGYADDYYTTIEARPA